MNAANDEVRNLVPVNGHIHFTTRPRVAIARELSSAPLLGKQSRWITRVLIRVIGHVYILRYSGPEVRAVPREISGGRAGGPLACLSPFSGVRCLI